MKLKSQNKLLSSTNARQYLYAVLEEITNSKITYNLPEIITINGLAEPKELNTYNEIEFIQQNGYASEFLQNLYDSLDPYFAPVLEMGQDGNSNNSALIMQSNFGSTSKILKGNGIISSPEKDLVNDICYFRKMFIDGCNELDYKAYTRAYRSYLLCSISLVECFLQRYIFQVLDKNLSYKNHTQFELLDSNAGLEKRIIAWLQIFTNKKESNLKETKEWCHFKEIKMKRNLITHPNELIICYEVEEMIRVMNYLKYGIGGLFILLRSFENGKEYIGFIRKIFNQGYIEKF